MHHIQLDAKALLSWALFVCWATSQTQGADLAYKRASWYQITDGDDETCAAMPISTISIRLGASYYITWVRVFVCELGYMHNLMLTMEHNGTYFNCSTLKIYTPDEMTRDLVCDFNETVDSITITGAACQCSLYVSGGRNVALKQPTRQSSSLNDSYTSDKAVDGATSQQLYSNSCSHTSDTPSPQWVVTLSSPAIVNRYVIFNEAGSSDRELKGFRLTSYNHLREAVFRHTDFNTRVQHIYKLVHADLVIGSVEIVTSKMNVYLILCEVEIYGESNCTQGYYGRECENKCNCFFQRECFVSTGGCLEGCATGYMGVDCNTQCPPGKYGKACSLTCSKFCVKDLENTTCHHETGACVLGCQGGYQPPICETVCPPGKFGNACKLTCSEFCVDKDLPNTTCHHVTGDCLFGCKDGYQPPPTCEKACPPGKYGNACKHTCSKFCVKDPQNTTCHHVTGACVLGCQGGYQPPTCETAEAGMFGMNLIIGMLVLLALLLLLGYCLYPRKKAKPKVEEEAHISASPPTVLQTTASSTTV